jgi:hypothetical protein
MNRDEEQEPIKKEVGGMKLPNGIAMGPLFFSKDGKTASAIIMQPAIISFDYGTTNSLNRLIGNRLSLDELQSTFNAQIEDLISEMLIYFQNRLKIIAMGNVGEFNSIERCVKEYSKHSIELSSLCDLNFLLELDKVRGRKHHSDRRYDNDYTINGISYNSLNRLRILNRRIHKEIQGINNKLAITHKDYDMKITQTPNSMSVEFTSKNHAFDLTKGGKVVPKNPNESKKSGIQD